MLKIIKLEHDYFFIEGREFTLHAPTISIINKIISLHNQWLT